MRITISLCLNIPSVEVRIGDAVRARGFQGVTSTGGWVATRTAINHWKGRVLSSVGVGRCTSVSFGLQRKRHQFASLEGSSLIR